MLGSAIGVVRHIGRKPRIPVKGHDGHVTDKLRLHPREVRHISREPRIPVTGYDGLVADKLRLNLRELREPLSSLL